MTTDQFVIASDEWSIGWNSTTMAWGSYFDITVYDVNTGNMIRKIEPSVGQTHYGVNYLDAKGTFYLQIFIHGDLGIWHVQVREFR